MNKEEIDFNNYVTGDVFIKNMDKKIDHKGKNLKHIGVKIEKHF